MNFECFSNSNNGMNGLSLGSEKNGTHLSHHPLNDKYLTGANLKRRLNYLGFEIFNWLLVRAVESHLGANFVYLYFALNQHLATNFEKSF